MLKLSRSKGEDVWLFDTATGLVAKITVLKARSDVTLGFDASPRLAIRRSQLMTPDEIRAMEEKLKQQTAKPAQ